MNKRKDTTATDDERRIRKTARKKRLGVPRFKVGDRVVVKPDFATSKFLLVEVKDVVPENYMNHFTYYGVAIKVNHLKLEYRIGHFVDFVDTNTYWSYLSANIPEDSVKWLEEEI